MVGDIEIYFKVQIQHVFLSFKIYFMCSNALCAMHICTPFTCLLKLREGIRTFVIRFTDVSHGVVLEIKLWSSEREASLVFLNIEPYLQL